MIVFASATATNALGVFSIFGGFLCGIAGSFHRDLAEGIKASIGDLVSMLFLPIFFVFSGLRTDIGSLGSDGRLWLALAAVIVVSCASKFGATTLAARAAGLPWKESASIGLLMNTRALMALVVINIGADMGVISPAAFFWLVTMALFTTVITTPILVRAYPSPEAAGVPGTTPIRDVRSLTAGEDMIGALFHRRMSETAPPPRPENESERLAAEAVHEQEERLRVLVSQMPAVLWTTDRELRFTEGTGAGRAAMGRDRRRAGRQPLRVLQDDGSRSSRRSRRTGGRSRASP